MAKPGGSTGSAVVNGAHVSVQGNGVPLLLGWYCPTLAAGRSGVTPLWSKEPMWDSDLPAMAKAIGTRRVKQFSVLGWKGKVSGHLSVMGLATLSGNSIAIGSYAGSSPCEMASLGQASQLDASCVAQTQECGLAVATLEPAGGFESRPYEEDPDEMELALQSSCVSEQVLRLDIDGDGKMDYFSIEDLLRDGVAPEELPAAAADGAECEQGFAGEAGKGLVRVATLDVDGDGRVEVLFLRGSDEFLLYGAPNHPGRLERLGVARGWVGK